MSSIELVVFDIAGTTVRDNGSVAEAFSEAFRDFGFEMPPEEIDKMICSDEVTHGRPYPEEGRNAACGKVVSVTTGAYTREQLEAYQPDHIIDDLEELLPIIEKA